jgi:hypothetical protein
MGFWIPIDPKKQYESLHSRAKLDRPIMIRRNGGQGTFVLDKYSAVIESMFLDKVMPVPGKSKPKKPALAVTDNSTLIKKANADISKLEALIKAETDDVKKAELEAQLGVLQKELFALKG